MALRSARSFCACSAAALYQGDLLEGLNVDAASFEEWLRADRERLRGRAVAALGRSTDSARPDTTSLLERDFALELDVQL